MQLEIPQDGFKFEKYDDLADLYILTECDSLHETVVKPIREARQDPGRCDICGYSANTPDKYCAFCRQAPCWHHGRCCPWNPGRPARPSRSTHEEEVDEQIIEVVRRLMLHRYNAKVQRRLLYTTYQAYKEDAIIIRLMKDMRSQKVPPVD